MDLHKLLFLAHQKVNVDYFDFVPYLYGSYSFQVATDLEGLAKSGWVQIAKTQVILLQSVDRYGFVKEEERAEARRFFSEYKDLRGESLVRYVYENFPYYATNSKIAGRFIKIRSSKDVQGDGKTLYTVGYEGISFEAYLNKLIKNKVQILCDVRKNPLSRKFGFSKGALSRILPNFDIKYIHIPELGIASNKRNNLRSFSDYDRLFEEYRKELPSNSHHVEDIYNMIDDRKNVALTCFENEAIRCHRSRIGEYMKDQYAINVMHL